MKQKGDDISHIKITNTPSVPGSIAFALMSISHRKKRIEQDNVQGLTIEIALPGLPNYDEHVRQEKERNKLEQQQAAIDEAKSKIINLLSK